MAYTVKIQFDGLFVFVHRPKLASPTLVVLMANTREHHPSHGQHPEHPVHEGWVQVGSNARRPLIGHLDLSGVGLTGGAATIRNALPLTSTTGEHVEEKFLTGDFPKVDKKLEGRVVLPMPKSVRPINSVPVEWENAQGAWVPLAHEMSGHIELEYDATGPVTIAGFTVNGDATVVFTYLPPCTMMESHPAQTVLKHSHMHSPIFKDKAPVFRTTKPFTAPAGESQQGSDRKQRRDKVVFGGDPVVCTTGNGCPPEDITCGGG